jgi:hypothetical protein
MRLFAEGGALMALASQSMILRMRDRGEASEGEKRGGSGDREA